MKRKSRFKVWSFRLLGMILQSSQAGFVGSSPPGEGKMRIQGMVAWSSGGLIPTPWLGLTLTDWVKLNTSIQEFQNHNIILSSLPRLRKYWALYQGSTKAEWPYGDWKQRFLTTAPPQEKSQQLKSHRESHTSHCPPIFFCHPPSLFTSFALKPSSNANSSGNSPLIPPHPAMR